MEEKTSYKLTRRDLLKLLAAGGGAMTAAAFVPEKWLKPVVKAGVLPVHAQSSTAPVVISNLVVEFDQRLPTSQTPKSGQGTTFAVPLLASFAYDDPLGQVSSAAQLNIYVDGSGQLYTGTTVAALGGGVGGGGFTGYINGLTVAATSDFFQVQNGQMVLNMTVGTRTSNTITGLLPLGK